MLIKVGLRSIISPTQASKALLFGKSRCHSFMPLFLYEVPLTSVWFRYKWFVRPCSADTSSRDSFLASFALSRFVSGLLGRLHCFYLDVFQYSTSKGLRRNILFLCPLLVPLPCSFEGSKCFIHKTLAYLFLRICWMISSQHLPQFDRENLD